MAEIKDIIREYTSEFDPSKNETAIILAAGHGKRIKSQTSKMLHKIWETPTVERVCSASEKGLTDANVIIVVGIKADEVVKTLGKRDSISYAYQEVQNGTGHAVQIALEQIKNKNYNGTVYIFPGDMGLIDADTVRFFKNEFEKSNADMMVLTGIYEGDIKDNYYGRIVRVKDKDIKEKKSRDEGKVIEIIEYKDILNLDVKKPYRLQYGKKEYKYSRKELIENREFNSGVYAFRFQPLNELIHKIKSNNVQKEIYLTDLIGLFNNRGYSVTAVSPPEQHVVMGFNNKSVLKEMEAIARRLVYEKIKDIIVVDDEDDFFIDEDVVDDILRMDALGIPLDIKIGKGVYIGKGVKLNYNLTLMKNVFLEGNIQLGKNIVLFENVQLTCFPGQTVEIGDNTEILRGDVIKGNTTIGKSCRIESGVRLTGSDQFPCTIGTDVVIKGLTYIFGSVIDSNIFIEHSVIIKKKIARPENSTTDMFAVRFYLPEAEGKEGIEEIL